MRLMRPVPATAYFTETGLRALIRNPVAVRHSPAQQMPGFSESALSDSEIDAVIALSALSWGTVKVSSVWEPLGIDSPLRHFKIGNVAEEGLLAHQANSGTGAAAG